MALLNFLSHLVGFTAFSETALLRIVSRNLGQLEHKIYNNIKPGMTAATIRIEARASASSWRVDGLLESVVFESL